MFISTSFKSIIASQRHHPTEWLWRECLAINSQFCEAVVKAGYLTWEQMVSAACRYRLRATRQGGVIFWQIDQEDRVRDGKVMYYGSDCHRLKDKEHHPTWVSTLLRQRDPFPNSPHETSHCFFGAHLISPLNERLFRPPLTPPNSGGETAIAEFRPLRGHKVIMFPDTDLDGNAFKRWSEAATIVMQQPFWEDSPPIRVSPLLETHATPEQKAAKIDLIDFLF